MNAQQTLQAIQTRLKAPKNQFNSFGKYKYRSLEDIQEAVKPLLAELEATLTFSDELVNIGDRYYIKATAMLTAKDGSTTECHGYAREAETKKGMDESQITGTASSYARKYAAGGLFILDDTKDADTNEHAEQVKRGEQASEEAYEAKVKEHQDTITAVKDAIAEGNLSAAIEAWYELSRDDQLALWKAPTKGGCFTTEERNVMKSDAWGAERKAMMGR